MLRVLALENQVKPGYQPSVITVSSPVSRTEQVFWKCLLGDRMHPGVRTLLENLKCWINIMAFSHHYCYGTLTEKPFNTPASSRCHVEDILLRMGGICKDVKAFVPDFRAVHGAGESRQTTNVGWRERMEC